MLVLAYNEETGDIGYYPVTAVWDHIDPVIVTLTIDGEQIETTPEHPFFTIDGEWLVAAELQIGDEIRTAEWKTGVVEAIDFTVAPQSMYNFTVATAHTYFVGKGQWLVHNTCPSLPKWVRGAPTQGVLDVGDELIEVVSGKAGGSALDFADQIPAFDPRYASSVHAESHAAAAMRQLNVSEATLYINNSPCEGVYSCQQLLSSRLPEGATMHIYVGNGGNYEYFGSFTGLSD